MSYGAYSLAKHCTRINQQNRAQEAYDNISPPEDPWDGDEEADDDYGHEDGYDGILGEG